MARLLFSKPFVTNGVTKNAEYQGVACTPNDGADLPDGPCCGIYVTGAGNVNINLAAGGTAVLTGLSAGEIVRVNASRILATSTTATGLFALMSNGSL
jgi:hypothetical protein